MKPLFTFFLPLALGMLVVAPQSDAQWSIRPIVVSYDTLPRTLEPATPSGMHKVIIKEEGIYFNDDHGIFLATGDSIIAIVSEVDTIPGTDKQFESFSDYGGLPSPGMWTTALGFAGSGSEALSTNDLIKPGIGPTAILDGGGDKPVWEGLVRWVLRGPGSVGGFAVIGPRKVGFTYAVENRLTFYVAQPGHITCVGCLPDGVEVNGLEYDLAAGDGLTAWLMEETPSGVTVYFVWNDYVRGLIGDKLYSAFFAFDGKKLTKLLAKSDQLSGGDSLRIGSVTGRINGPLIARDREGDRWAVQAVYGLRRKTGEWTVANGIVLMDRGSVTSIVQAGDSITSLGGTLPGHSDLFKKAGDSYIYSVSWQPDFSRRAVILVGDYLAPDKKQAMLIAQDGAVKPLGLWENGTELPGTSGGRFDQFTVLRKLSGKSPSANTYSLVSLDSLTVTSLVGIAGSRAGISQGIFRCKGATVQKLVMQGDSISQGRAHVVSGLGRFEYLGSPDELVFSAEVDDTSRDVALLCVSGGKINEIASTVQGGAIDRRRPGRGTPINFTFVGQFKVIPGNRVVFLAGNPTVSGWFLAERTM